MKRITSRQNTLVAAFRDAARDSRELLLLDGPHLLEEALDAGLRVHHAIVSADARARPDIAHLAARLLHHGVDLAEAAPTVMAAVSPVRSSSPIVALAARPPRPISVFTGTAPLVVIACDIQDPGNIGAIIRVAEGAGASGLIVAGQAADPFGWKALRGSMGSALRLPIAIMPDVSDAIEEARQYQALVMATVPRGGVPLFDAVLTGATALLIGGEGVGLSDEVVAHADARITIPMAPPVESLNAAVAAAVLLYEARRQRTHTAAAVR